MVCPTGVLPALTSTCPKCGSVYRRGELVQEGKLRKPVPIRARPAGKKEEKPIDFDKLSWTSLQPGQTADEAVEQVWAFYRKYPGRRRRDPKDVYEVVRVYPIARGEKGRMMGGWRVTVQRRSRKVSNNEVALSMATEAQHGAKTETV